MDPTWFNDVCKLLPVEGVGWQHPTRRVGKSVLSFQWQCPGYHNLTQALTQTAALPGSGVRFMFFN